MRMGLSEKTVTQEHAEIAEGSEKSDFSASSQQTALPGQAHVVGEDELRHVVLIARVGILQISLCLL